MVWVGPDKGPGRMGKVTLRDLLTWEKGRMAAQSAESTRVCTALNGNRVCVPDERARENELVTS